MKIRLRKFNKEGYYSLSLGSRLGATRLIFNHEFYKNQKL